MGIHFLPNAPVMTVAIFCGESKPLYAEEYLGQFVEEMNELQRVGIVIGKRHYTVHLPFQMYSSNIPIYTVIEQNGSALL